MISHTRTNTRPELPLGATVGNLGQLVGRSFDQIPLKPYVRVSLHAAHALQGGQPYIHS